MMTPWQLHTSLWTITLLRREELVAEGVIDDGDDEAWARFIADRFGWIMMHYDKSEQVWRAIWRHVPADYRKEEPAPVDNVVNLARRRTVSSRKILPTTPISTSSLMGLLTLTADGWSKSMTPPEPVFLSARGCRGRMGVGSCALRLSRLPTLSDNQD